MSTGPCSGSQSLLAGSLAEGSNAERWAQRAAVCQGVWPEQGLTGHEQVGLLPPLLIVMQCLTG